MRKEIEMALRELNALVVQGTTNAKILASVSIHLENVLAELPQEKGGVENANQGNE